MQDTHEAAAQPALPCFPTYSPTRLQALPIRERPAYRVGHVGPDACSAYELLAAVVGGPRQIEVAHDLLARYENLGGITRASVDELAHLDGLGPAKAAALHAALALGRRMMVEDWKDKTTIRSPADVTTLLMPRMSHLEQEEFWVLFVDTRNRLIGEQCLYRGSLNASHIRVAEVYREAARRNCAAIIVSHNHPSGDPTPSPEDVEITRMLVDAGDLLDVELLDHLVIGMQRFVSLRERGLGFE